MPQTGPAQAEPATDLTVVIVSYNTVDLTRAAIRTLYATTQATSFRCVVFDNASSDGSAEAIAAEFPQVELIASDENLGFAKANNLVVAEAKTPYILLLNPDTEVHEGAVDTLMAFARANPQAGIWGGRTVFPDGSLNIASCWGRITPWSLFCRAFGLSSLFRKSEVFNPEAYGGWQRDSVREVDIVVGCFLLTTRDLWTELGGFNLKYFMYGEDADLCLRARAKGYRPMITPDATIMHLVGASTPRNNEKAIQVMRGRASLIRDHWSKPLVPFGLLLMLAWSATRYAGTSLLACSKTFSDPVWVARWKEIWQARATWIRGFEG